MRTILMTAAVALLVAGCGDRDKEQQVEQPEEPEAPEQPEQPEEPEAPAPQVAVAKLAAAPDQDVSGMVTFTMAGDAVTVDAHVQGLEPGGTHGFHVHEEGDCSGEGFESAGGHFDPLGHPHAAPEAEQRHVGDLGNLEADDEGTARKTMTSELMTLTEGETAIVGKAVIVHAGEDDLETQPTGDAGGRIACGVIELQEPGGEAAPGEGAGDGDEGGDEGGASGEE